MPVGQDMQAELKDKTNAEKVRLQLSTSFDFLLGFPAVKIFFKDLEDFTLGELLTVK